MDILILGTETALTIGIEITGITMDLDIMMVIEEAKTVLTEVELGIGLTAGGHVQKVGATYSLSLKGTDLGRGRLIVIDGTTMNKIRMSQMFIDRTMEKGISTEIIH